MQKGGIEKAIVKIECENVVPSYSHPWTHGEVMRSQGSGFCVLAKNKKYVLTNAHVVEDAAFVRLKRRGTPDFFKARPVLVIFECDLALLSLDEDHYAARGEEGKKIVSEFWNDLNPLSVGGVPGKLDKVFVYGYPRGGYNVSVTRGIVNRMQMTLYHDGVEGIALQVDAAINPGNSGGPALDQNGAVIGVAFQVEARAESMGYVIPSTIIRYFLHYVSTPFQGICDLYIKTQSLNNQALRQYYHLDEHRQRNGILVNYIYEGIETKLQLHDILLAINGHYIYHDGTMLLHDVLTEADPHLRKSSLLQTDEVVPYHTMISLRYPGDLLNLTVIRGGKEMVLEEKVQAYRFLIRPLVVSGNAPGFFIVGGLIFLPVNAMLIDEKERAREYIHNLRCLQEINPLALKKEEPVLLSRIIPTEFNSGYYARNYLLKAVNGIEIDGLIHLHSVVERLIKKSGRATSEHGTKYRGAANEPKASEEASADEYLAFTFQDTSLLIVLRTADVKRFAEESPVPLYNAGNAPPLGP